jgi:hypothetical protein
MFNPACLKKRKGKYEKQEGVLPPPCPSPCKISSRQWFNCSNPENFRDVTVMSYPNQGAKAAGGTPGAWVNLGIL